MCEYEEYKEVVPTEGVQIRVRNKIDYNADTAEPVRHKNYAIYVDGIDLRKLLNINSFSITEKDLVTSITFDCTFQTEINIICEDDRNTFILQKSLGGKKVIYLNGDRDSTSITVNDSCEVE